MREEVSCRILRPDDLHHIEAISKGVYVYEGISVDYLVDNFPRWIMSPARRCYGLFVGTQEQPEQTLVCFHCDLLLDMGTTIFIEGLRTLPDHRGNGLRSTLNNFIALERQKEHYCNVKRIRKAIANVRGEEEETAVMMSKEQTRCADSKNMELLGARSLFACRLNAQLQQFIKSHSNETSRQRILEYSSEQLGDRLTNFSHFVGSATNKVLTTNWICYEPTENTLSTLSQAGYGGWTHRFWGIENPTNSLKHLLITNVATVSGNEVLVVSIFSQDVDIILSFLYETICGSLGHPDGESPPVQFVHVWFPMGLKETSLKPVIDGLKASSFFRSICIFMETPCSSTQLHNTSYQ